MKTTNKKHIKFIASIDENNSTGNIEAFAKILTKDGIKVEHVSTMLGYISGSANASLVDLQNRYEAKGLRIEEDRDVGI